MNQLFKGEKQKRTITLIACGLGAAGLVWFMFGGSSEAPKDTTPATAEVNVIKKEETLEQGFRSRFGKDLIAIKDSLEKQNKNMEQQQGQITAQRKQLDDLQKENQRLNKEIEELPAKLPLPENKNYTIDPATGNKIPLPPSTGEEAQAQQLALPQGHPDALQFGNNGQAPTQVKPQITVLNNLIVVGKPMGEVKVVKAVEEKKATEKKVFIPKGSFVKATILTGVIAPTAGKGAANPVPALLRITGISQLPNFAKADIAGCFLLAETKGNLATETVSFRLKDMSCIMNNGDVFETTVNGYVAGENGVEGLIGRVVSKQGAMLARAFVAEFASGLSTAFEESQSIMETTASGIITTRKPSAAFQTGMFAGAAGAASRISDFYMDLADNMVPVIEIHAGRAIDVVFTTTVDFSKVKK